MPKKIEMTPRTAANKARREAAYGRQFNRKSTRAERRQARLVALLRAEQAEAMAAPPLSAEERAQHERFFGGAA